VTGLPPVTFQLVAVAGAPAIIEATLGGGQAGRVGTNLPNPLVATVRDAFGNLVSGTQVDFTIQTGSGPGLTLTPASASTDALGQAATVLSLGERSQTVTVAASAQGVASPALFTATAQAGAPTTMILVGGDNQQRPFGETFDPFEVRITDIFGNAAVGATVQFVVRTATATISLSEVQATTDADGEVETVLAFQEAGTATVEAVLVGVPNATLLFTAEATATPQPASLTIVGGDQQSASVGSAAPQPLEVQVIDTLGDPMDQVDVSFAVVVGQATLVSSDVTTGALGTASTGVTLGTAAGAVEVRAAVAGLPSVTFDLTALAGPAASIVATDGDGQSGTVGDVLGTQLVATVRDSFDNPVSGATVSFAVTVGLGGNPGLSPSTSATDASGEASTTLTLGSLAGTYVVTASTPGVSGSSATFTATANAGPAVNLELVSGNNQVLAAGESFDPFVVKATDLFGNAVAGTTVQYTVQNASTAVTLPPAAGSTGANGEIGSVIDFQGVPGTATVEAAIVALPAAAVSFAAEVAGAGQPAFLDIAGGDGQVQVNDSTLALPLEVIVTDVAGDVVDQVDIVFSVTQGDATVATPATKTDANGVASTDLTLGTSAGPVEVRAFAPGTTLAPVFLRATSLTGLAQRVNATSGDLQIGALGSVLLDPIVATVTDDNGNPIAGVTVEFEVIDGAAALVPGSAVTDGTGSAATSVVLTTAGIVTIRARVDGLADVATYRVSTPGVPASLDKSGDGQTGLLGTILTDPLITTVLDLKGAPIEGVEVSHLVTAGGGSVSQVNVTTDALGRALTFLSLGPVAGTNAVSASVVGLATAAEFTAVAAATKIDVRVVASGNGQTGPKNSVLPDPLVVKLVDTSGVGVTGGLIEFRVLNGAATVTPATAFTDINGFAQTVVELGSSSGPVAVEARLAGSAVTPVTFNVLVVDP
jgi:adhesin/invasin